MTLNPKIIHYLKAALPFGLAIFFQLAVHAQGIQDAKFLQKVGIEDSLYSQLLKESRKLYVQIPEGYSASKNKKYPVAYILDGELFLPTVYEVQKYYSGGFTPEMVLVGISNEKHRIRDLTPSQITSKYGMPFNEPNGEAETFLKFIEEELIPYVENTYPVTKYRTLIGHSYGGLFAIHTLLNQPELFANYLAIDPSLDWDDQLLLKEAEGALASKSLKNKGLFLSLSGQLHMQDATITMANVMQDTTDYTVFARSNIAFSNLVKKNQDNGLSFGWKFYPNDIHGTVPFPSIMDGLITLFDWFQMENTDKINSFDTSKETLFNIIKYREKKLQDHFGYEVPPYPEELLNMSGYMNMDMQQSDKAKMYFELATEYYPKSANAYDSLAEYYEAQGDFTKALELAKKASTLSDDDYYKNRVQALQQK